MVISLIILPILLKYISSYMRIIIKVWWAKMMMFIWLMCLWRWWKQYTIRLKNFLRYSDGWMHNLFLLYNQLWYIFYFRLHALKIKNNLFDSSSKLKIETETITRANFYLFYEDETTRRRQELIIIIITIIIIIIN